MVYAYRWECRQKGGWLYVFSLVLFEMLLNCVPVILNFNFLWHVLFRNPPKALTCRQHCSCLWELFSMRMWMFVFMHLPAWKKHYIEIRYKKSPLLKLKINQSSFCTNDLKLVTVGGCSHELCYSPQFIKLAVS